MRRIEARRLPSRRCRVVPGEALEPRPLIFRPDGSGPAAQEGSLGGRVGDAGEPGVAGLFCRLCIVPGIRLSLGAAQHRLRQGQAVALALDQNCRLVRFGGDRLLPSSLQQRLTGPIRILRHEIADLVSRRGARCQQPEVGDELGRDRIGVGCGGELGVRPPVGSDGRGWVARLRQSGRRGQ